MGCRPHARATTLGLTVVLLGALTGCGSAHNAAKAPKATPTASRTPAVAATYPLTGLPATDAALAARPALSIKVDNVRGAFPQQGLNQADIVADCLVEGGLTRLLAIFQSHDAATVGPIRSARPVDADLLRLVGGGLFAYSGAATGEIAPTIDHGHALRISYDANQSNFFRIGSYASPHNVFASTTTLYGVGRAQAPNTAAPPPVFSYSVQPGVGGVAARTVVVPMSGSTTAGWTWNGSGYLRTQDHNPDVLADGSRVSTTNVVIMSVAVRGTGIFDAAHNEDPLDVVIGSGSVWVLRDGVMFHGTWSRPSVAAPMVLTDATGHVISLKPGRTWLELLPRPHLPTFG